MKKLSILAILLLVLAPASAMAGMTAASDMDLADVSGQVGITISMTMSVTATGFAWGDSDGFAAGGYPDEGWVIARNVSMPSIGLSGVTIDAGTTGGTSRVQIGTGGPMITGDLIIGSLVIGTSAGATTPSLGEIRVTGISIGFGDILIGGH